MGYKNKTTPDLSIVKRLGGSRVAKVGKDLETAKFVPAFYANACQGSTLCRLLTVWGVSGHTSTLEDMARLNRVTLAAAPDRLL